MSRLVVASVVFALLSIAGQAQGYSQPTRLTLGRRTFGDLVASSMLGVGSRAGLMGLGVGGGATVVGFPRAALASEKMTIKESTSSGLVGDTVSYEDFTTVLMRGEAAKVQFYGTGEECYLTTKDGKRLRILGVAKESANSPLGPASTVAKCRDFKVPFTFESYDLTSFRKGRARGEIEVPPILNPFEQISVDKTAAP